jgi:hypothetical protein
MILLSDNDVRGAVTALRHAIEHEWPDIAAEFGLRFVQLEDLGLSDISTDAEIYEKCHEVGAILVTGDRSTRDGPASLENVIRRLGREDSYPVITIADQVRLLSDPDYKRTCAFDLLAYVEKIDDWRGTRRVYLPSSPRGLN